MNFNVIKAFLISIFFFLPSLSGMPATEAPAVNVALVPFQMNDDLFTSVAIHPSGRYVLFGTRFGLVFLADQNGTIRQIGPQFRHSIKTISFSPNGTFFIVQCNKPHGLFQEPALEGPQYTDAGLI